MHHQLITRDPKTKKENPVSIRCAWPELVKTERRGKKRGFRSHLLGNRELDCRVIVKSSKRVSNQLTKMREDIAQKRMKRNRLALIIRNPEIKVGAIDDKGKVQPRKNGKFLPKVQVKY